MSNEENTMSTDVSTREPKDVAEYKEPIGVSGDPDPSDYVTPIVSLVQGQSAEGTPGHFRWSTGGERPEVNFTVVHIALTRTYFATDEGLVCRSSDRKHGYPRKPELVDDGAEENQAFACRTCRHYVDSPYTKDACKLDYALTCFDLDTEEPFLFRVKGSALGVFRNKVINGALRGLKPPWYAGLKLTSEKKTDKEKGRNWYEPRLAIIEEYDTETKARWAAYANQFERAPDPDEEGMVDADDLPFE